MTLTRLSRRRRSAGFSLLETVIAASVSAMAMLALVELNVLASRFTSEGFREAMILNQATSAIEQMTRRLNHAYRLDADPITNAFAIQNSYETIEFSVPNGSGTSRERYRFNSGDNTLRWERQGGGGGFAQVGNDIFLENVEEFSVDNQEGIISLVLRLRIDSPRSDDKQYTLVGRALPRNI